MPMARSRRRLRNGTIPGKPRVMNAALISPSLARSAKKRNLVIRTHTEGLYIYETLLENADIMVDFA
ncbi:hypothetical protein ACFFUT_07700 [Pseudohalocynthiibacter aestuariivivens]|uniref:Uncharacterized protein n=1 Tax=Pseudohalocynthiibacter aestuariivivens TaxID=1591409 RepID=A0ABV5JDY0_9RHOB|nr:hypothetical protein [Pseudohalocynthiibacter aestuariivivens]MBS9718075.1 hypothetical protein [Pseudohalocynthiibacter aestuariivivens]